MLRDADADELQVLQRALQADTRKGVQRALEAASRRIERIAQERERVGALYRFQREIAHSGVALGLDEVGRGPLAGPLTIGGVVLNDEPLILGLNDSKQVPETARPGIAKTIRNQARAWTIQHIPPGDIDEFGMTACLKKAFKAAIDDIEAQGVAVDVVLLDGNPLHIDPRETNVIKGDAKCACIAAASLIAKVERDSLMADYSQMYPLYGFDRNKGYGSAAHIKAIEKHGMTPIHRRSFCHFTEQPTLF